MKNHWLFLIPLALGARVAAADAPAPVVKFPVAGAPPIIKLPPEIAVKSLAYDYSAGNLIGMAQWVVGAQNGEPLAQLNQEFKAANPNVLLTLHDLHTEIKGDEATVTAQLELRDGLFGTLTQPETLQLRREGNRWKIVPDEAALFFSNKKVGFLLNLATAVAHPDAVLSRKATDICLTNAKAIGLGWLLYQQDYEDEEQGKVELTVATFKDKLMPYIKAEAVFHCASDKDVSFALNDNVTGVAWSKLEREPTNYIDSDGIAHSDPIILEFSDKTNRAAWNVETDKLVLFYEGSNQNLDFRHHGYAIVCLVNGHVQLVNEQQAKLLKWKL